MMKLNDMQIPTTLPEYDTFASKGKYRGFWGPFYLAFDIIYERGGQSIWRALICKKFHRPDYLESFTKNTYSEFVKRLEGISIKEME